MIAKAVEVPCERVGIKGFVHHCSFDLKTTEINSDDVKISDARNENTTMLFFYNNIRISFLPIEIHEKFPDLLGIIARDCAILTISKKNVNKLRKLEVLDLAKNKIQKIESDSFDDLTNIEFIGLGKRFLNLSKINAFELFFGTGYNQIKFLNGKLFELKPKLNSIDLSGNICINKDARRYKEVQSLLPVITEKCGFDEKIVRKSKFLDEDCGRVSYISDRIIGGNEIVRGKWPFLVALIMASDGKYFCGGNLISSKHVLTAAHCLYGKGQETQLEAVKIGVLVGRHNLNSRFERDSEQRNVAEILMHPNWKSHTEKYDSDLAILVLDREVKFSAFIQPVCLTKDPAIMDQLDGTVVI